MGKGKRTRAGVDPKNDIGLQHKKWNVWASLITTGFHCVTAIGIAYFSYLALVGLSDKTTIAKIALGLFVDYNSGCVFFAGTTILLLVVWVIQQISRRRLVKKTTRRIKKLEERLDRHRSSTRLQEDGSPKLLDRW